MVFIVHLEYFLLRLVKRYIKNSSERKVMKITPRWNSNRCTAEFMKIVRAHIRGSSISFCTDLSIIKITIKQSNARPIAIPPVIWVDMPKEKTVNLNRIRINTSMLMMPVNFTGSIFSPLIFDLISDNGEAEIYTNIHNYFSFENTHRQMKKNYGKAKRFLL